MQFTSNVFVFKVCNDILLQSGYWHTAMFNCIGSTSISISSDSLLDESLNQGPSALLLRSQYEFRSGIDILQFSFSWLSLAGSLALDKIMHN